MIIVDELKSMILKKMIAMKHWKYSYYDQAFTNESNDSIK